MKVYLVRHSEAVGGEQLGADGSRYLSTTGRELARSVGKRLAEAGVTPDRVLTSPLVRAVQTAELMTRELGYGEVIEVLETLGPSGRPEATAQRLGPARAVMLVGHAPSISALGALLVARPSFPPLRPAQVAVVDRGEPGWTLNPSTLEIEPLHTG